MRNFRALALALLACLAVGAATAGGASAAVEFHVEQEQISFEEEQSEGLLTFNNGQVLCSTQDFKGEIDSKTKTSTEILLEATYACGGPLGTNAQVKMNGCKYRLDSGETDPESNYLGLLDILCSSGKQIEISETIGTELKCRIKLPEQKAMTKVTYQNANEGKGKERYVIVSWNLTGIKYTQEAGFGIGKCKGETASNGTYETIFHLNNRSTTIGFWVE